MGKADWPSRRQTWLRRRDSSGPERVLPIERDPICHRSDVVFPGNGHRPLEAVEHASDTAPPAEARRAAVRVHASVGRVADARRAAFPRRVVRWRCRSSTGAGSCMLAVHSSRARRPCNSQSRSARRLSPAHGPSAAFIRCSHECVRRILEAPKATAWRASGRISIH